MKNYRISMLFLFASMILFGTAFLVGSHLDANGRLIEPVFFCIPLGYLSLAMAFFNASYHFVKNKVLAKIGD